LFDPEPKVTEILGFFLDNAMASTAAINAQSTLERIQRVLQKFDAVPLPRSLRPAVETLLIGQVAKMMDSALPWQQGHGRRTAALARSLGACAGLSPASLHQLTLAALLHDIGLLALPPALISHTGCLDGQSYAARQSHPRVGAETLEPYRFLQSASIIIAHHHERWDGSGYPYGLRGTFVPIEARVLAIADAVDAIHVPGVIDARERDKAAYRILTVGAGTQFDPHLVDLCGHCLQPPNLIVSVN
jgi:response regulator RpfG family c-di-GMP phosphodiesterase